MIDLLQQTAIMLSFLQSSVIEQLIQQPQISGHILRVRRYKCFIVFNQGIVIIGTPVTAGTVHCFYQITVRIFNRVIP